MVEKTWHKEKELRQAAGDGYLSVSYTHLDVYKRQVLYFIYTVKWCVLYSKQYCVLSTYVTDHKEQQLSLIHIFRSRGG